MLEIINQTPLLAELAPGLTKQGQGCATLVIKGTFGLQEEDGRLPLAEEQVPVQRADDHLGEPGVSSMRYELDTFPFKPGTDVVLNGHAHAQKRGARTVDVSVTAGPVSKTVRVFGDRHWYHSLGSWKPTEPEPFERVPLVWERAFGGTDQTDPDKHRREPRNPIGAGFSGSRSKERLEGLPLANLEDPSDPIRRWRDRPAPAGFGFVGRHWTPRSEYGGTYDDRWVEERCPLLPDDFDEAFYNGASAGLVTKEWLEGGEAVRVANATPSGELAFHLPRLAFEVTGWVKDKPAECDQPHLDTVVIEPDDERVILVWRATIRCGRDFLHLDRVRVRETTPAELR